MATRDRYPQPLDSMDWHRAQNFETTFAWEYDDGRDKLLNLYRSGMLRLDGLVTRTYRLEDVNQGYEDMREGRNLRGVIEYTDADY